MRFAVLTDKGQYLAHQLEAEGHTRGTFPDVDLLLLDCDWPWAPTRPQLIEQAAEHGVKVALYPHGGQATFWQYDGLCDPDPRVDLRLEHGPRSVELAVKLGLDLNQHSPGWLFSPTRPFTPVAEPVNVLFAPLHPNMEAMQHGGPDIAPRVNQHAYRSLLNMGLELGVSVVGPLWRNGIWQHPRASFVPNPQMRLAQSLDLIDQADAVVAAGTLAAAAVALGKPTVFLDEPDCADYLDGAYRPCTHAAELIPHMRYPLVATDGPVEDLLAVACAGSAAVDTWREWWVGDDGTVAAVRVLEHLVGEQQDSRHVSIGGVTARASGAA